MLNIMEVGDCYVFARDELKIKLEGRFWNCQGKHIAIVAIITKDIDWASYIGADVLPSLDEDSTLRYVARYGCKLSEDDARYFFPGITLPYRR